MLKTWAQHNPTVQRTKACCCGRDRPSARAPPGRGGVREGGVWKGVGKRSHTPDTCDRWSARRGALGHVRGRLRAALRAQARVGAGAGAGTRTGVRTGPAVSRARRASELVLPLGATAGVRGLRRAGRPLSPAPRSPGRGARRGAESERAWAGNWGVSLGAGRLLGTRDPGRRRRASVASLAEPGG